MVGEVTTALVAPAAAAPGARDGGTPSGGCWANAVSEPATSTTGRAKRSTNREATIPITPSFQSAPAIT